MVKKLFCSPYAGGSSYGIYGKWMNLLKNEIEIIPLELPGRGPREGEVSCRSIEDIVQDSFVIIQSHLQDDENAYGLWGHSMGGLIVYELGRKIIESNIRKPRNIIITGRKPFGTTASIRPVHKLSDQNFIDEIISLNGTPKEVFEDKNLREYFLPILRHDFEMLYNYEFAEKPLDFDIPLTVIKGNEERYSFSELCKWNEFTSADCDILSLPGDHFFINNNVEEMTKIIRSVLNE